MKDAFQSPYRADGKSACLWTEITGSAGVFAIDHTDLPGKMHFEKLTFLLHKSGGVTISEPKVRWWVMPGSRVTRLRQARLPGSKRRGPAERHQVRDDFREQGEGLG
ncbi:hypothetical protein ACIQUG_15180 [Ensifer sp. NPDC090286]|uniref:hypothetical protein n=1 Tax=Ensifer sp. NPDC090286 TaxID=3363991 RepID=UPI00383A276D